MLKHVQRRPKEINVDVTSTCYSDSRDNAAVALIDVLMERYGCSPTPLSSEGKELCMPRE
jgi:hypothetical protein